jgi:hypothetical protein
MEPHNSPPATEDKNGRDEEVVVNVGGEVDDACDVEEKWADRDWRGENLKKAVLIFDFDSHRTLPLRPNWECPSIHRPEFADNTPYFFCKFSYYL